MYIYWHEGLMTIKRHLCTEFQGLFELQHNSVNSELLFFTLYKHFLKWALSFFSTCVFLQRNHCDDRHSTDIVKTMFYKAFICTYYSTILPLCTLMNFIFEIHIKYYQQKCNIIVWSKSRNLPDMICCDMKSHHCMKCTWPKPVHTCQQLGGEMLSGLTI